jgi:hypothetical protein
MIQPTTLNYQEEEGLTSFHDDQRSKVQSSMYNLSFSPKWTRIRERIDRLKKPKYSKWRLVIGIYAPNRVAQRLKLLVPSDDLIPLFI